MKRARSKRARLPLLRRLSRSNRLFPRRLKLTREGKVLVALALGVGFGAINTGNNLLYLVFALMLSLIITSGILSDLTLRKVTAELTVPPHAYARRPHIVRVAVRNDKRLFSSFSLHVELIPEDDAEGVRQRAAYLLHLHRREAGTANLRLDFARRGRHRFAGVRVATSFPFGFFRKSRFLPGPAEVVVYPAIVPVATPSLRGLREMGTTLRPMAGRGDDYYALRELRSGDDVRDIYWKASARRGELVVRDFEEPVRQHVTLYLPNVAPDETRESLDAVERTVEVTASLAGLFVGNGANVGLVTLDRAIAPAGGRRQLHTLLRHLAIVEVYVRVKESGTRLPRVAGGAQVLVRHPCQRGIGLAAAGGFDAVHELAEGLPPAGVSAIAGTAQGARS